MSYCQHDIHCPGYGPEHEAQSAGESPLPDTWGVSLPPTTSTHDLPPMEELLKGRATLRKQAKSGHPARKAKALRDLFVLERIIADAKRAAGKSEVDYV